MLPPLCSLCMSLSLSLSLSVSPSVYLSLSPPPTHTHTYSLPPHPPPHTHTHKQRNKATTNQTNKKQKKTKRHKKRQRKLTVHPQAILNGRSLVVCAQNTVGLRLLKKSSTGFVVCKVTAELCDRYSVARRSGNWVVKWPLLSHYPNRPYPLVRDPIVLHNSFFSRREAHTVYPRSEAFSRSSRYSEAQPEQAEAKRRSA